MRELPDLPFQPFNQFYLNDRSKTHLLTLYFLDSGSYSKGRYDWFGFFVPTAYDWIRPVMSYHFSTLVFSHEIPVSESDKLVPAEVRYVKHLDFLLS